MAHASGGQMEKRGEVTAHSNSESSYPDVWLAHERAYLAKDRLETGQQSMGSTMSNLQPNAPPNLSVLSHNGGWIR